MRSEIPIGEYSNSNRLSTESPPDNGVEFTIAEIIKNSEMFQLPNKPKMPLDRLQLTAEALAKQYTVALQHEKTRIEILSEINRLLQADKKDSDWIRKIEVMFDKAPQEAASEIIRKFAQLPEKIREEVVRLALDKAPREAAPGIMWNLKYLSEGIREEIIYKALDKAPQEAAPTLMWNFKHLLMWNFKHLPKHLSEKIREEVVRLALDKAPREAAPGIMWNLKYLSEGIREEIIYKALDKAPREAAPGIMGNLAYIPKGIRKKIIHIALDKAPQEAAPGIIRNLEQLPKKIREKVVRLALDKAPQEAAPGIIRNLEQLPKKIREEVVRLALDKAPQEAAPEIIRNLEQLPEKIREEIIHIALDKAPQEAASEIMRNLAYLPEEMQAEIASQFVEILQRLERNQLTESENINPILYEKIEGLDKQFSRRKFPKTGTETVLLGGTLINNVILRIIPTHAFIGWVRAYSAVDKWKEAGFDYVPIEPILKAGVGKDGRNVRVYAGVLGVSVRRYLEMYSTRKHHQNVRQQVKAIREMLEKIDVIHGHDHEDNFVVLHNRTPEGEIDWEKPPRVYCIDFDESVSSREFIQQQ